MKRLLTAILALWSVTTMAGLPPTTLGGQAGTAKGTFNFKTPNLQATAVTGGGLIETGNTNLLANPSFEASTASTSWTLTSATGANDTTNKTDGTKGLAVTVTSTGGGIKQTSTINAASLVGSQGVARVSVYTTGTDVHVCPLMNGSRPSDVTKYCALVPKSTTAVPMPEIIVPFIMDGTSNGIEIYSDTTTAFTVDEVSVGKSAPFQGVSGAKLLGTVTITGCAAQWSTTGTTFADFATQTGCTYATTGQAQAPSTNIPAIKFASLPAGDVRLEVEGLVQQAVANKVGYFQFWDGVNTAREISQVIGSASSVGVSTISQTISYSTTQSNVTLSVRSKTDSSGSAGIYASAANPVTIKVWYFPPESRIYSQQAYYPSIVASTSSFSTTAGNDVLVTLDTIASNDNSYALSSNGVTIVRPGTYKITLKADYGANNETVIQKLDVNGAKTAGQSHQVDSNGAGSYSMFRDTFFKTLKTGDVLKFYVAVSTNNRTHKAAEMVIDLVDPTPTIVGSFAGIEKCANDYECTDTFSAYVSSAGVVSNSNIPWINGNCAITNTSQYTCTYNTNLKDGTNALASTMNCNVLGLDSSTEWVIITASTDNTKVSVKGFNSAGTANASGFSLKCQKASPDYKPKTAKVATSIDVVTTPIGNNAAPKIYSFTVAGDGTVSKDYGDLVNGNCAVSNTSTYTCTLNSNKFTVAPNCSVTTQNSASDGINVIPYLRADETTSSIVYRMVNGNSAVASAQAARVICHGY